MNKYEKQVNKLLLEHEEKLVKDLKAAYSRALADVKKTIKELRQMINELTVTKSEESLIRSKVYQLEYQELLKTQIDVSLNLLSQRNITTVTEFLQSVYNDSFLGDIFILHKQYNIPVYVPINAKLLVKAITQETAGLKFSKRLYENVEKLKKVVISEISRGIAQGSGYAEIARNISDITQNDFYNAYRIARTEGGRVSTMAQIDSLEAGIKEGADLLKRWDATLDKNTRDVHAELDGQIAEYDGYFESSVGQVKAPHMFGIPEQDINCRCRLSIIPRWDLDKKQSTRKNNITGEIIPYKTYFNWKKGYLRKLKKEV